MNSIFIFIMKKFNFVFGVLIATVCFQQCVKEQGAVTPPKKAELSRLASLKVILPAESDFMKDFIESSKFNRVLSKYHFQPLEFFELQTDQGDVFYAAKLGHAQGMALLSKETFLVIYPSLSHGEHTTLIYEQEIGDMSVKLRVFDAQNYSWLAEGEFSLDVSGKQQSIERACADTTNSFNECFICAWNQLTNDALGIVACATNPWSCAAAATLHCAVH